MTTEMALQRVLAEFQMDWLMLRVELGQQQPDAAMQLRMLERLKQFRLHVLLQIHEEMQMWVNEFHSSLLQLEKSAQLKAESTSATGIQPPVAPAKTTP